MCWILMALTALAVMAWCCLRVGDSRHNPTPKPEEE